MKPKYYYGASGLITGIGFATVWNCFGLINLDAYVVVASALYVGWGFSLWYFDDEIKTYIGVTE